MPSDDLQTGQIGQMAESTLLYVDRDAVINGQRAQSRVTKGSEGVVADEFQVAAVACYTQRGQLGQRREGLSKASLSKRVYGQILQRLQGVEHVQRVVSHVPVVISVQPKILQGGKGLEHTWRKRSVVKGEAVAGQIEGLQPAQTAERLRLQTDQAVVVQEQFPQLAQRRETVVDHHVQLSAAETERLKPGKRQQSRRGHGVERVPAEVEGEKLGGVVEQPCRQHGQVDGPQHQGGDVAQAAERVLGQDPEIVIPHVQHLQLPQAAKDASSQ